MSSLVSIKDLSYKYPMGGEIFESTNFNISKGEFNVLLGKNGCGKSTLIHLLLGHRTPTQGEIKVLGLNPKNNKIEVRKNLYFMSHLINYDKNASIHFILNLYKLLYPGYSLEKEEKLLDLFELSRSTCVSELSLGQACRIQLVAGVSSNAELLLIDEVTAVLDPLCRKDFTNVLIEEAREGRGILMATNIPDESEINADNVYCVKNKEIKTYEP
ncbi:ABC transporter ATP-binding protein [Halobacteriovorax sp. JY17]|uniref:ATP-binding cassette domain-containing protein n=1 Tax=Halobacteriovorax sp. JY17 TaxID=2014617 RepID=UPI000C43366D|nr:ABC transporter ATP-binding protein [Halobacteriovorax sp. JY17]PIK15919.1 MAG: hypothetical protein CES88_04110 [Halobacteriovorax sp. JY17]